MDLTGRTLLGKYRIEKILGRGGMGSVWKGEHTATGRPIAVKLLEERFAAMPSVVERFGREARAASAIRHEGIVEVLDLDRTEEGRPFLVMEFLEGQTLSARLEIKKRLSERELADFADQLLDALDAAHERGVVHRDLKPDNIYLTPTRRGDRVKLLDFGISSKADEKDNKLTATGSLLGTPHYVSPEQANGDSNIDRRSDIYSCGSLFYECVVGEVPFDAATLPRLLIAIVDDPPVPPRERGANISAAMEAVILKAMSKNREARPATASQLRELILGAADGTLEVADVMLDAPTLRSTLSGRRAERGLGRPEADRADNRATGKTEAAPARDGAIATLPARRRPQLSTDAAGDAPFHAGTLAGAAETPLKPNKPDVKTPAAPAASLDGFDDLGPRKRLEVDADALATAKRTNEVGLQRADGGRRSLPAARTNRPAETDEGRSWGGVILTALAVGGLAIAGVLIGTNEDLRRRITGSSPVDLAFAAPAEIPDAGPDWVSIELTDLPAGASVTMNGLSVSGTSVRVRVGTTQPVVVRAPGFIDRTVDIIGDADHTVSAALEAVPEPSVRPRRRPPR